MKENIAVALFSNSMFSYRMYVVLVLESIVNKKKKLKYLLHEKLKNAPFHNNSKHTRFAKKIRFRATKPPNTKIPTHPRLNIDSSTAQGPNETLSHWQWCQNEIPQRLLFGFGLAVSPPGRDQSALSPAALWVGDDSCLLNNHEELTMN